MLFSHPLNLLGLVYLIIETKPVDAQFIFDTNGTKRAKLALNVSDDDSLSLDGEDGAALGVLPPSAVPQARRTRPTA